MDYPDDLIIHYFSYLINDYGFHVVRKEFDYHAMGNAVVIFESAQFGIEIVIDRNQVLISIGEQSDPRKLWFEFTDVIKYYAPNEKKIYDFQRKTEHNTWDEIIEIQLTRLADMLRRFCEPLLTGILWQKEKLNEIKKERRISILKKFNQWPTN
jgi:hypothetical protein